MQVCGDLKSGERESRQCPLSAERLTRSSCPLDRIVDFARLIIRPHLSLKTVPVPVDVPARMRGGFPKTLLLIAGSAPQPVLAQLADCILLLGC